MKLKRNTECEVIGDSIVELAQGAARAEGDSTVSISLEFALAELVRGEMRLMAQNDPHFGRSDDFLRTALRRVLARVETALDTKLIRLDLHKYEQQLLKTLKFPAKEIQSLGEKLAESRSGQRLGKKEELVFGDARRFVVHELGLREAIHGVLVEPVAQVLEINVSALREQRAWRVAGDWFPYEVFVEEFVFVVDDDGSIYVSTANLPEEIRRKVTGLITRIAELLFS